MWNQRVKDLSLAKSHVAAAQTGKYNKKRCGLCSIQCIYVYGYVWIYSCVYINFYAKILRLWITLGRRYVCAILINMRTGCFFCFCCCFLWLRSGWIIVYLLPFALASQRWQFINKMNVAAPGKQLTAYTSLWHVVLICKWCCLLFIDVCVVYIQSYDWQQLFQLLSKQHTSAYAAHAGFN